MDKKINKSNTDSKKKTQQSTKIYNCDKCSLIFEDYSQYEKHKWNKHPSNEYENTWAQIKDWSNLPLAYRDDPYY